MMSSIILPQYRKQNGKDKKNWYKKRPFSLWFDKLDVFMDQIFERQSIIDQLETSARTIRHKNSISWDLHGRRGMRKIELKK